MPIFHELAAKYGEVSQLVSYLDKLGSHYIDTGAEKAISRNGEHIEQNGDNGPGS